MNVLALGPDPGTPAPLRSGGAAPAASVVTDASPERRSTQSPEGMRQAVAAINRAAKSLNNSVELSLDSHSGQPVVRVVDTETGQLIRQIPTEEVLELRRALDRIAGLLIHRTA